MAQLCSIAKSKLNYSQKVAKQQIVTNFYQGKKSIRDTCFVNYRVDPSNNFRHITSHTDVKVEIKKFAKNKKIKSKLKKLVL